MTMPADCRVLVREPGRVALTDPTGLVLVLVTKEPEGVRTVTLTRAASVGPFTVDDARDALERPLPKVAPGENRRTRRVKLSHGWSLWLTLNTGPPTWWAPRVKVREGGLLVGWLRALVAVHVKRASA